VFAAIAIERRAIARRAVLVCLVGLGLTACGSVPEKISDMPDMVAWQLHQQQLEQLDDWSFNGRIAVRDAQDEGWSASLRWQQQGDHYDIQLSGALGQGAARIHGNGGSAVMEAAGEAPRIAPNPEALMQEQLGWHVPVRGLKFWLTGRPGPDAFDVQVVDGLGRLSRLEQDGWEVIYSRYEQVNGVELPRKLEMSNRQLRVRLVIDQWSLDKRGDS
jgi:outer membrane lipoprotein LolB